MQNERIALVTGGTGGIGSEICKALVDQGRHVVAGYFPPEREAAEAWQAERKAEGYDIDIFGGDVSDYDCTKRMIGEITEKYGQIDIRINCAGITRDKTLRKMSREHWADVISTNLDSAFNVTSQVVDQMTAKGFGRIVNISSVNGQKGQFGQANYSAAKAGLHGFTKAVAQELAAKGVTVNTVSPGYVETAMTSDIPENILADIVAQVPVGRMAKPEEIAYTVSFLTDERNNYMTGANLPVNGGMYMA